MAESFLFLLSSRQWSLSFPGWPAVEQGWSYGFFWRHSFSLGEGLLRFSLDGLRAHLYNPLLWDVEQPWRIHLFSGKKPALYQTLYGEIFYEQPDRFRVMLSYKHQEVVWFFLEADPLFRVLLPRDRVALWATWTTLSQRWQVDGILSWTGPQRLPSTQDNPPSYRIPLRSPAYAILTLQLTHRIDQWEIQLACENLNNFRQATPVIAADRPFSPYLDASLIWGPIMGRMASLTLRYTW
jgi:hypothetical protein